MSTALYRRYRPETFAEMIGQEHVTGPLSAALTKNRVSHAYLFSGPRGCGKTTSARILARCLNCEQGPTSQPCGQCESCIALARGGAGSLDVIEIDAASHRGIDDAREIRERAAFAPASSRYKIFIIDEAHQVTKEGFNALLKIVEEPPEHVKFVFATTEPDKVIGTIRSRTHHYPFRLVPPSVLQTYLRQVCEAEGVAVAPGVLPLVVRAGAGSVRDSLSVLDQLIAGADEAGLTYPLAVSLLGYTDAALLDSAIDALAAGDGATVFTVVDQVVESGHDPRRFVEDLLERLRDLVVVDAVPDGAAAVLRGLPEDQLDRMRVQASAYGRSRLSRAADIVNAALTEMTGATSPRLQLELLCARLLLAGEEQDSGLRMRVERLERQASVAGPQQTAPVTAPVSPPVGQPLGPGAGPSSQRPPAATRPTPPATPPLKPSPPAPSPSSPPQPKPQPAPTSPPRDIEPPLTGGGQPSEIVRLRQTWPAVLEELSHRKRATWSLLSQHAQILEFDGRRLLLGFSSAGLAASFGRGGHAEFLRQALIDVVHLDVRVEATSNDRPVPAPTEPQQGPVPHGGARPTPEPSAQRPPVGEPPARRAAPAARPTGRPQPPPERPERGSRPAPPRPAAPSAHAGAGRRGGSQPAAGPARGPAKPPSDDVPWPDDPPPEEEPPPEDEAPPAWRTRKVPPGPASSSPAPVPGSALIAGAPRGAAAQPNGPTSPPKTPTTAQRAKPWPSDDEPSPDDENIEDSGLVGTIIVEQVLGGRVIEERNE